MLGRRDSALHTLGDKAAASAHVMTIERDAELRREMLLEMEVLLGLESPPELQMQRRALQMKQLRERFQGAAATNDVGAGLLAWCAQPGIADARDRTRVECVFLAMEQVRRAGVGDTARAT